MQRYFGQSWKTTLVSYVLAVMLAVQPLLNDKPVFDNWFELTRYFMRLVFAGGVAFLGKYAADISEVKDLRERLNENVGKTSPPNDS